MKPPIPCHHCGRPIRAVPVAGHPWRHVETGEATCAPTTKAEPASEHRWVEVMTYGDIERREECTHCGITRAEAFS